MRSIIISVFITITITSTALAKNPLRYNYKVLKCIDSILSKRKVLKNAEVTRINSFLEKLDRKSPNLQKRNLKKCKSIKRDVKKYSRSIVDDEEMKTFIQQSALEKKDFLTNLIFPEKLECGGKEMTAQAAFLAAAGSGQPRQPPQQRTGASTVPIGGESPDSLSQADGNIHAMQQPARIGAPNPFNN